MSSPPPDDPKELKNVIAACVVEILSQVFVEKQKLKETETPLFRISDESTESIKNNLNRYFKDLKHLQMMLASKEMANPSEIKQTESILSQYLFHGTTQPIKSLTERSYEKQPSGDLQDLSYLFKSAYNQIEKTLSDKKSEKKESIFSKFAKLLSRLFS